MEQEAAGAAGRRLRAVPPPREQADRPAPPLLSRDDAAPEVRDLLAQLDDLRLTLSADLGLAASAVDADALAVARDVIAGAQDDLAVFEVRAGHALRDPARPAPVPVEPAARRRWQRLSVLAPGLTAAAALVGLLLGVVPSTSPAAPDTSIATDAASSWDELRRLHEQGASSDRLGRAARQLQAEVGRLVGAGASPVAVSEALRLLELQRRVLSDPEHADELGAELAESQRLVAALRATVVGSPVGTVLADAPLPAAGPLLPVAPVAPQSDAPPRGVREVVPAPAPVERPAAVVAVPAPAPAPERPAEPAPAPTPAPTPAPAPSPAPAPAPAPEQQQQPASEPSASPTPSSGTPSGTSSGQPSSDETGATPGSSAPASAPPVPFLPPRTSGTLVPE